MAKTVLDKFTNQFLLHDHVNLKGDLMTGALTITPSADSVSIFIVNKADATPVLTVDTSGGNVITSGYTYLGGTSSTGLRIKGTDTTNTIWQPNSGSTLAIAANGGSITLGQTSDPDFTLGSTGLITTTNSIGIGGVPSGNQRLNIAGTQTGSDNAFGVYMGALTLSPATTYGAYFQYVGGGFVATGVSNTIALAVGLYAEAIQKTGTGTIIDTYGLYVNPSTTGSNNYGAYIGGNVGIGTTSPSANLDVVGSLDFSGVNADINLFSSSLVGNTTDGYKLIVSRNATEGSTALLQLYVSQYQEPVISMVNSGGDTVGIFRAEDGRISLARNWLDVQFFRYGDANPAIYQYGNIAATNNYIKWQISDTDDCFHLTRQDTNLLSFNCDMPLKVTGNISGSGVILIDDVQVVSNRVIDARIDDVINSGDATTDGVIDALRDAMITHGLIAAA